MEIKGMSPGYMDKTDLRFWDGVAITGSLVLPGLFYTAPGILAEKSGSASWIAVLFAHAFVICLFLLVAELAKRHGSLNIIETASLLAGRPVGVLYGAALSLYFCYVTGTHAREAAEIIRTYGLRLTPVYVIAGIILGAAVIMNLFGGRSLVKSVGFFFIFVILGGVFIALLGMNRYNPDYLFPVLGFGLPDIAGSGRYIASMLSSAVAISLFAPCFGNKGAMRRSGVIALAISAALSVMFYLCFIMMFSAPVASKMISGFMEMGKSSYYNHFFYRFESVLLFFIIFSSVIMASVGLYIARHSVSMTFRSRPGRAVTTVSAVMISAAAFIPGNLLDLINRHLDLIGRYGIFFMAGLPLLLFIISSIKRIGKHENS